MIEALIITTIAVTSHMDQINMLYTLNLNNGINIYNIFQLKNPSEF